MGREHAEVLDSLRAEVLDRLIEIRASIDHAYARIPDDVIRGQFDVVLSKMRSYLSSEAPAPYQSFVLRWAAMREGEGFGAENVINSVVAIGDVLVKVARERLGQTPEARRFARAVTRMSFFGARMLVQGLADELAAHASQLEALEGGTQ